MRALLAFSKTVAVFAFNVLNATWYRQDSRKNGIGTLHQNKGLEPVTVNQIHAPLPT
jgi:hypothetical protein